MLSSNNATTDVPTDVPTDVVSSYVSTTMANVTTVTEASTFKYDTGYETEPSIPPLMEAGGLDAAFYGKCLYLNVDDANEFIPRDYDYYYYLLHTL